MARKDHSAQRITNTAGSGIELTTLYSKAECLRAVGQPTVLDKNEEGRDHEVQHQRSSLVMCNLVWGGDARHGSVQLDLGRLRSTISQLMSSVYPGYHASRSFAEVTVGTLYGVVDGLIGGAVFAWLYNCFASSAA